MTDRFINNVLLCNITVINNKIKSFNSLLRKLSDAYEEIDSNDEIEYLDFQSYVKFFIMINKKNDNEQ